MATVTYDHATRFYPDSDNPAVDRLSLDIGDGEFMVLVGPSGSGKSTALRMLAGLEDIDDGTVRIGDKDVTDLEPRKRDIAMVFQSYALYPHDPVRGTAYGAGHGRRSVRRVALASRNMVERLPDVQRAEFVRARYRALDGIPRRPCLAGKPRSWRRRRRASAWRRPPHRRPPRTDPRGAPYVQAVRQLDCRREGRIAP
ncbi:MAG TPA: ATP-binding cassette domain-containing protein [Jiangellaceae bacterium]|nr:ATP-binding cassette domain-containing protein [Jiangellaceae bacterium]